MYRIISASIVLTLGSSVYAQTENQTLEGGAAVAGWVGFDYTGAMASQPLMALLDK